MTERFKVQMSRDEDDRNTMTVTVDGEKIIEQSDGGEPEDNSFRRDWKWVPQALERAYAIGLQHAIAALQKRAHDNATEKGFWDDPKPFSESIALMHSELSEALEADRHGDPRSDKIPEFTGREEELADAVIRILDVSAHHELRLGEAVLAKMDYNASRPRKHGKALLRGRRTARPACS